MAPLLCWSLAVVGFAGVGLFPAEALGDEEEWGGQAIVFGEFGGEPFDGAAQLGAEGGGGIEDGEVFADSVAAAEEEVFVEIVGDDVHEVGAQDLAPAAEGEVLQVAGEALGCDAALAADVEADGGPGDAGDFGGAGVGVEFALEHPSEGLGCACHGFNMQRIKKNANFLLKRIVTGFRLITDMSVETKTETMEAARRKAAEEMATLAGTFAARAKKDPSIRIAFSELELLLADRVRDLGSQEQGTRNNEPRAEVLA